MMLRQVLAQRPRLVAEENCEFGMQPRPKTYLSVDFALRENKWCPVVILTRATREKRVDFGEQGFPATSRGLRHQAKVIITQEDPTGTDVFLVVHYKHECLEYPLVTQDMRPFVSFTFEDGSDPNPRPRQRRPKRDG